MPVDISTITQVSSPHPFDQPDFANKINTFMETVAKIRKMPGVIIFGVSQIASPCFGGVTVDYFTDEEEANRRFQAKGGKGIADIKKLNAVIDQGNYYLVSYETFNLHKVTVIKKA